MSNKYEFDVIHIVYLSEFLFIYLFFKTFETFDESKTTKQKQKQN